MFLALSSFREFITLLEGTQWNLLTSQQEKCHIRTFHQKNSNLSSKIFIQGITSLIWKETFLKVWRKSQPIRKPTRHLSYIIPNSKKAIIYCDCALLISLMEDVYFKCTIVIPNNDIYFFNSLSLFCLSRSISKSIPHLCRIGFTHKTFIYNYLSLIPETIY